MRKKRIAQLRECYLNTGVGTGEIALSLLVGIAERYNYLFHTHVQQGKEPKAPRGARAFGRISPVVMGLVEDRFAQTPTEPLASIFRKPMFCNGMFRPYLFIIVELVTGGISLSRWR